jgi:NADPH:quinone reductase-like Zn-dependent oxidoreductase
LAQSGLLLPKRRELMKAIVYTEYGTPDVLQLQEVAKPTPKDNEILIRVYATTVNYGDLTARNFKNISSSQFNMPGLFWLLARMSFGLTKPKITILGSELAGEVEAVGKDIKRFKIGDQVFGYTSQSMGAYAEYRCMSETAMVTHKPNNMTYEEAAAIPYGAIMALSLLKKINLQPKQQILINGASGAIGSAAVQLAKFHFGAQVTGVCSTRRLGLVKSLGADCVIDYSKQDFTKNAKTYDVIFDILGKGSFRRAQNSLKQNGRYLCASFKTKQLLEMLWTSIVGKQKAICAFAEEKLENLELIKALCEAGEIKAFLDRSYLLEQAAEAHRYIEAGHRTGSVVITLD